MTSPMKAGDAIVAGMLIETSRIRGRPQRSHACESFSIVRNDQNAG
jgi:hypothetical protein